MRLSPPQFTTLSRRGRGPTLSPATESAFNACLAGGIPKQRHKGGQPFKVLLIEGPFALDLPMGQIHRRLDPGIESFHVGQNGKGSSALPEIDPRGRPTNTFSCFTPRI